MCSLSKKCSDYKQFLTDYQFSFLFDDFANKNARVSLANFAVQNGSECQLHVNKVENADNVFVLGSMWLQDWDLHYNGNVVNLTVISNSTLSSVSSVAPVTTNSYMAFAYPSTAQNFTLMSGSEFDVAYINASIGFQGWANFQVSLTNNYIATYAQNCTYKPLNNSCSGYPNYATNYFNFTG